MWLRNQIEFAFTFTGKKWGQSLTTSCVECLFLSPSFLFRPSILLTFRLWDYCSSSSLWEIVIHLRLLSETSYPLICSPKTFEKRVSFSIVKSLKLIQKSFSLVIFSVVFYHHLLLWGISSESTLSWQCLDNPCRTSRKGWHFPFSYFLSSCSLLWLRTWDFSNLTSSPK